MSSLPAVTPSMSKEALMEMGAGDMKVVPKFVQDARDRFETNPFTLQVEGAETFLTERVRDVRERAHRFVHGRLAPIATRIDLEDAVPDDLQADMAREGFFGLSIPMEYGGAGSVLETCMVVEELSRASASVGLLVAVQLLGSTPLVIAGTEEQKQEWLPSFATGERFCSYCLTEPGAGTDAASVETRAERMGDGWTINGTKHYITGAGRSSLYTVFARTGEDRTDLAAFLVPNSASGFTIAGTHPFTGIRGVPVGRLDFDAVQVADAAVLGEVGKGFRVALATLDRARPAIAAQALGLAQGALDASVSYLGTRVQFGEPLLEQPVVQYRLARHAASIAAARQLTYHAAQLADRQDPALNAAASMAKLFATDLAMQVATDAMQLWGGAGYMIGSPVERMFRDAKIMQIYEGTNEIQALVIARALMREYNAVAGGE